MKTTAQTSHYLEKKQTSGRSKQCYQGLKVTQIIKAGIFEL